MKTDIEAEKEYEVDKSEVKERGGDVLSARIAFFLQLLIFFSR